MPAPRGTDVGSVMTRLEILGISLPTPMFRRSCSVLGRRTINRPGENKIKTCVVDKLLLSIISILALGGSTESVFARLLRIYSYNRLSTFYLESRDASRDL